MTGKNPDGQTKELVTHRRKSPTGKLCRHALGTTTEIESMGGCEPNPEMAVDGQAPTDKTTEFLGQLTATCKKHEDYFEACVRKFLWITGFRPKRRHVEDVLQESYMRAAKTLLRNPHRTVHEYKPWFTKVLLFVSMDYARYHSRSWSVDDSRTLAMLEEEYEGTLKLYELWRTNSRLDDRIALNQAVGKLDTREQNLLELRYRKGYTAPEIADLTGLSVDNVRQIISRAYHKLREILRP